MITLLRSMSFIAKEWLDIDNNEVRYNKTVADSISWVTCCFKSATGLLLTLG